MQMISEIDQLSKDLEANTSIHVAVFQSADPDFFIAHADVELIRQLPTDHAHNGFTILSDGVGITRNLEVDQNKNSWFTLFDPATDLLPLILITPFWWLEIQIQRLQIQ